MKPFVKWVGGKTQLLKEIIQRMPKKYNSYFEPFVGGGAVLFCIAPSKAYINDAIKDLMITYEVVKNSPLELMNLLKKHELNHIKNGETYFLNIRSLDKMPGWDLVPDLIKAARLIYLNKSCFNGIYRVNSKNEFNVPWNQKKTIKTFDKKNILDISSYLSKSVEITSMDFEELCKFAKKGDFVFFDPPYDAVFYVLF